MKRILFAVFVLFAMASCSETTTDSTPNAATEEMEKAAEEKIEQIDNQVKEIEKSTKEVDAAIDDLENI